MNLFVVDASGTTPAIVTPPTDGTILAGITRASLLGLAPRLGYRVHEIPIAVDEWRRRASLGEITEAFASGTGAVVAPIGRVDDGCASWTMGDGTAGPVTRRLRANLLDLQEGRGSDPFGWRLPLGLSRSARGAP
jgi:branched-chain amino acid aminotransferase